MKPKPKLKIKGQYRQGDVLIERATAPKITGAAAQRKRWRGSIVLAEGEATGHHHRLELKSNCFQPDVGAPIVEPAPDPADWWKQGDGDDQYVSIAEPAQVTHEEHGPIELEPDTYRVRRQREYSPGEIRRVAD